MKKLKLYAILSSLLISSCGFPKVTDCVVDYPINKAHCAPTSGPDGDYDLPLDQMEKYSCFYKDDFADLIRGVTGNLTVCVIVSYKENDVHCNAPSGSIETTLSAIHKYNCLGPQDMADYKRWKDAEKE